MADFSPSIYGKTQVKGLKRALFLELFNLFIFISTMIAEDPVLPWYNDLEVLPFCFCKAGEAHRLPEDACNEAGVPYIRPIIYIRAIDNPNSFKPLHAVKTGMHEYTCLICWETHKGNKSCTSDDKQNYRSSGALVVSFTCTKCRCHSA